MAANAGKIIVHTVLMLILLQRNLDGLRGFGVSGVFVRSLFAAVLMGFISWLLWFFIDGLFASESFFAKLIPVLIPGGSGLLIYLLMANLLGIEEARHLTEFLPFKSRSK